MAASAREYLFSLELLGIKLGLQQIRALVEALGHPHRAFPSIVIAGTNGKGSVTAMVERGLRGAGLRTGRYTSPHLVEIEERVAIDGAPIAAPRFDAAAERVRTAAARLPAPPSFFEATTALALDVFREAGVDVAVLEVGLGGRLDATNVVDAVGVGITSIDFDHEVHLGSTIEAIAAEKAGVIKPGAIVVLGRNRDQVRAVVQDAARTAGATLRYAPDDIATTERIESGHTWLTLTTASATYTDVRLALAGRHQIDNAVTTVRLLEALSTAGVADVPPRAIREGLEEVSWPARLEWRRWRTFDVLIDGAHNPAGAHALAAYLSEVVGVRVPIVVGVMRDKAVAEILAALVPVASHFVMTAASSARAASPDELTAAARTAAPRVPRFAAASPAEALTRASTLGTPVVVAGSLFLAGEIRAMIS